MADRPSSYPRLSHDNALNFSEIETGLRNDGYSSGVELPSADYNELMNEVDAWIEYIDSQLGFAVLTGTFASDATETQVNLPEGFTKTNCMIIAFDVNRPGEGLTMGPLFKNTSTDFYYASLDVFEGTNFVRFDYSAPYERAAFRVLLKKIA